MYRSIISLAYYSSKNFNIYLVAGVLRVFSAVIVIVLLLRLLGVARPLLVLGTLVLAVARLLFVFGALMLAIPRLFIALVATMVV